MTISPTRISGAGAATQLDQDWKVGLKDENRKIPLALTDDLKKKDPETYKLLSSLKPDQLKALQAADKNGDGQLTLKEAKTFLIKNGAMQAGGKFDNFTDALNSLFTSAAGKTVDVRSANSSVLYLTFNNNTEKGTHLYNKDRQTAERNGLTGIVAKDPDKPDLTGLDLTKEFNKGPAEAKQAFRDGMQKYLDDLVKNGGSMSGLVISGHSDGTNMLFEAVPHGYTPNLDIRAELKRFKEMENPPGSGKFPYKDLFNNCEKVGLLACFQGGKIDKWRDLFPNAVIAGTENFSPDAGSAASPAIYGVCQAARQYYEDGGDFAKAEDVGRKAPGSRSDGLQGDRGLKVSVPGVNQLTTATADFDKAKKAYADAKGDIDKALRDGKSAVTPARMRELYKIVREYEGAAGRLKSAGGSPIGPDGKAVDVPNLGVVAQRLFDLRSN